MLNNVLKQIMGGVLFTLAAAAVVGITMCAPRSAPAAEPTPELHELPPVGTRVYPSVVCLARQDIVDLLDAQREGGMDGANAEFRVKMAESRCLPSPGVVLEIMGYSFYGDLSDGPNWIIRFEGDYWGVVVGVPGGQAV